MSKKQAQKSAEKNKLYELSSGLSVLFAPVFFALAFLTGYHPNASFPFLWHSVVIFLLVAGIVFASLIQKDFLKKPNPTAKKLKQIDYLSYFNLACLGFCVIMMLLAQTD